ncbi:DNA polymerase III subunit beta [Hymenobacter sp. 102]|uniref:DNA polymerase III subunit beta n=1 Tax=Hymenobacter sp. 102 TaxID=3403152 RepID=UPI003CF87415
MSTSVLTSFTTSFLISSAALLKSAQFAGLLVKHNPVVPILENLLLRIEPAKNGNGSLQVCSCDLEHFFTSKSLLIEGLGTTTATSVCVPAKQLTDLLRSLNAQPLTLRVDDSGPLPYLHVQAAVPHSLLPLGTGRAKYALAGEPGSDFVRNVALGLPTSIVHVPAHLLLAGLATVLPVLSRDDLRPAMTGVYVEITKSFFRLVGTDGHRLVRFTKDDQHVLDGPAVSCIIPRRAAEVLVKLLDRRENVELVLLGNDLFVKMQQGQLRIRLLDEKYPDYENVLPKDLPNVLTAHRLELLAGVKRCELFANKITYQLVLRLNESTCEIIGEDKDFDNLATESVPGTFAGEAMTIGLNSRFLAGFLAAMPCQNVQLRMSNPNRAVVLQSADAEDGLLCLLMPVMLNNY